MDNLEYLPQKLIDWLKDNNETIKKVDRVWLEAEVQIQTDKNIYRWDFRKDVLYLECNDEFERVLYPERAVETSLWKS